MEIDMEHLDQILKYSTQEHPGNGITKKIILHTHLKKISGITGKSVRCLERTALEHAVFPERFTRNTQALSASDQLVLLNSCVTVVGLGGLGGAVTEILARVGIGSLTLIDGDVFEPHNLNRQFLALEANIGESKAITAEKRVKQIDSSINVRNINTFLTSDNAEEMLDGSQAVCDCLDTISVRFILEKAAKKLTIPVISGAVAGFSGQTLVIFPEDQGFRAVYGDPDTAPEKGSEKITGTVSPAVTLIASYMCCDLVNVLLQRNIEQMRNQLRMVDLENNLSETVKLE